jgi:type II secretory ATPase GspE/PulE/Tfp pilus assembly ATPase PilB-like protein
MLTEYCEELRHTASYRSDPQTGMKRVFEELQKQYASEKGVFTIYKPVGCDACGHTGYKGRLGLHELLVGSDAIKKQIQEKARVAEMFVTAVGEGMRTLKMDGIEKVLSGFTDMAQVRAVCIK